MCRHLVLSMLPFSFSVILHCTVINSLSVDSEHLEDNYVDQLIAESKYLFHHVKLSKRTKETHKYRNSNLTFSLCSLKCTNLHSCQKNAR